MKSFGELFDIALSYVPFTEQKHVRLLNEEMNGLIDVATNQQKDTNTRQEACTAIYDTMSHTKTLNDLKNQPKLLRNIITTLITVATDSHAPTLVRNSGVEAISNCMKGRKLDAFENQPDLLKDMTTSLITVVTDTHADTELRQNACDNIQSCLREVKTLSVLENQPDVLKDLATSLIAVMTDPKTNTEIRQYVCDAINCCLQDTDTLDAFEYQPNVLKDMITSLITVAIDPHTDTELRSDACGSINICLQYTDILDLFENQPATLKDITTSLVTVATDPSLDTELHSNAYKALDNCLSNNGISHAFESQPDTLKDLVTQFMTKAPDPQSDLYSDYIAVLQSVVNIEMMRKVLAGDATKPVFMADDKAIAIKTQNRERWDIYTANGTAQIGCTSATVDQDEYKPQLKILRKFVRNTTDLNMEDSETRASYYLSMQRGVMDHFAENKNKTAMPTHAQLLKNGATSLFKELKAT